MNFNWTKGVGYGVLIWAVMFVIGWILTALNVNFIDNTGIQVIMALIAGAVAFAFAADARPANAGQAFGYGIIWVAAGLILDTIITGQMQPLVFTRWAYWLGYALILLSPWFQLESHTHAPIST